MTALCLTINLYDPLGRYAPKGPYVQAVRRILELCETKKTRATFFTSGAMALSAPLLVQEIASLGHEIAYAGHRDLALTEEHPEIFQRETYVDKDRLEQLAGYQIIGYRAPHYSLTAKTLWAIEKLGKLGFKYSSSVVPSHFSRHKIPSASHSPFLWANSMVEVPVSVAQFGPLCLPYLGGFCLAALPFGKIKKTADFMALRYPRDVLMASVAPFEFEDKMGVFRDHNLSLANNGAQFLLRQRARTRLGLLLNHFETTEPLGCLISKQNFKKGLPKF